jgi:nucleoside-diphosphate-sugar epimerase
VEAAVGSAENKPAAKKAVRSPPPARPIVLVTGAAGDIGSALVAALADDFEVVGLDREGKQAQCELFAADLTSPDSTTLALQRFKERYGRKIASVIHLAAYFDFTGKSHPLYEDVNIKGTRNLLHALQEFEVEQFVYSGTMLVHRPGSPGMPINERTAIDPGWAYPESKAKAEEVIREDHGAIPYVLLHLAGVYDELRSVPTLAEQIKRIYERDPEAHAYSGSVETGQAFVHKADMVDAFKRAVERRKQLPENVTILVGEEDVVSYGELQEMLAKLLHNETAWKTWSLPKPLAKAGAWLQLTSEPVIPDAFDEGKKPFIRPFMIAMADDHYELDTSRARELLGWTPSHSLRSSLPEMVRRLKDDPLGWYKANGLSPPYWLTVAAKRTADPERLRRESERRQRDVHRSFLWAPFLNMALGASISVSYW